MTNCGVCGTTVQPPFHSFCSHDCIDVVAGRKPEPVQTHTNDGHGLRNDPEPVTLWLKANGLKELAVAQVKYQPVRHLDQRWKEQVLKSWDRVGGEQAWAYYEASRRARQSGKVGERGAPMYRHRLAASVDIL